MKFLHIKTQDDKSKLDKLEEYINKGKHVFVLIFMEGCGPCNATRPEWDKLESSLGQLYNETKNGNDDIIIADVNNIFINDIKNNAFKSISGFPTMLYFNKNKNIIENYEDSVINIKDRSVDSFINWIQSKVLNVSALSGGNNSSSSKDVYNRIALLSQTNKNKITKKITKNKSKNKQKGGKWSRKYKKSINCKKPKGFSQKQYCKYGRNKNKNKKGKL
jgi:thiol-disulfide isomerase/thioredoxin